MTPDQIGEEIVQNYNTEFRNTNGDQAEEIENANQPEAEAEPVREGEEGVRVPAHLYFEDNASSRPRTWITHYLQAKIVHENFSSKVKKKKMKLQFLFRASQK